MQERYFKFSTSYSPITLMHSSSNATGRYRWTICALAFFATTINYLDRQVISLLKPYLEENGLFGTDPAHYESVYANIVICFQVAFASGMLMMGNLIDRIGTKIGYAVSLLGWSIAAIGHAFAKGPIGFGIARAGLGVPEAGNYPAVVKTIAEWFPQKERALATGIVISGTNIGAILAPMLVPVIAENIGWQWAFILTGAVGLVWLVFWQRIYDSPAASLQKGALSQKEYEHIQQSDATILQAHETAHFSWGRLFRYKQTWAIAIGKFLSDPVWWFFLFWLPAFLKEQYGLKGVQVSIPLAVVYSMTTFGSIFGGWLPKYFTEKGMQETKARKRSMLLFAFLPVLVLFIQSLGAIHMWLAVVIIGIAGAGHQAWSTNIFTTASDMFPKKAVASVTGIAGMAGAAGAILIAKLAGSLFDHYKALGDIRVGYGIVFSICAFAYLAAWLIMHALAPKFTKVDMQ